MDDPAGDPVVDGTDDKKTEPRADIVKARASYSPNLIAFTLATAQNVHPSEDPRWRSSSTFQTWEVDTNGDGTPDFEVQYFFDEDTLSGGVSRVGDPETDSVCTADALYWTGGYAIGFAPTCVGSPDAFSYRVKMHYDTDPGNENADVLSDTAPNGGFSRPVAREAG